MFGVDFKRVILTGDSAGGSLATSLTVMSIVRGYRVPDAVLTSYPTTIASPCNFWPSLLSALDDPVLSVSFLNLMAKAYTPEDQFLGCRSQLMSPGLCAPDSVLSQFPKFKMVLAGVCPLKDDGIYFLNRLLKNGVDATCKEFVLLPHGFLNYNLPYGRGMAEARPAINKIGEMLI